VTGVPPAATQPPTPIPRSWRKPSAAASPSNTNSASWPRPTRPRAPAVSARLLRREGLYSSLLATWRREREAGVRQALSPQKRGPKSKRDPIAEENQQLRRETQRLTEELRKAEIVIDIQKKVATLLGRPLATVDPEEKP
jgi:transposase